LNFEQYYVLLFIMCQSFVQFSEIDLSDMLPPSSLAPFMDEIKKREKQRKRAAKKVPRYQALSLCFFSRTCMRAEYHYIKQKKRGKNPNTK
jgi:ATP-dependent exoDNAse (exonuclease V) beta subunit